MHTEESLLVEPPRDPCTCSAGLPICPACLAWEYQTIPTHGPPMPTENLSLLRFRLTRKRRLASKMKRAGDLVGLARLEAEIREDLMHLRTFA